MRPSADLECDGVLQRNTLATEQQLGPEADIAVVFAAARLTAAQQLGAELTIVSCREPCIRIGTRKNRDGGCSEVRRSASWLWATFRNGYNVQLATLTDTYAGKEVLVAYPGDMLARPLNRIRAYRARMSEAGVSLPW